jgi:hypothetical protein
MSLCLFRCTSCLAQSRVQIIRTFTQNTIGFADAFTPTSKSAHQSSSPCPYRRAKVGRDRTGDRRVGQIRGRYREGQAEQIAVALTPLKHRWREADDDGAKIWEAANEIQAGALMPRPAHVECFVPPLKFRKMRFDCHFTASVHPTPTPFAHSLERFRTVGQFVKA